MNYEELKTAILSDSHRSDYTPLVERFIAQGEALISASLEGYFLETTINEAARVSAGIYTLPAKVTTVRHVIYNNAPLKQVDETSISNYRSAKDVFAYCMRDLRIVFAGIPPTDAVFSLNYYGMPAALSAAAPSNNLLNDYPQLYIEAAQIYVFKRARNFDVASAMTQSVASLIREINRKTKKKLGGAESANPYNVSFRSSY